MRSFDAWHTALNKQSSNNRKTPEQIDAAIRQLVSSAITTDGQVIDVFTAAGLSKPDISILSDRFLAELRGLKHKNVAVRWRIPQGRDQDAIEAESCASAGGVVVCGVGVSRLSLAHPFCMHPSNLPAEIGQRW